MIPSFPAPLAAQPVPRRHATRGASPVYRRVYAALQTMLFAATLSFFGCSTPGAQLAQCQAEKDQLLATLKTERIASQELNEKVASLEARLDESEKLLAGAPSGARVSTLPATRPSARAGDPVKPSNAGLQKPAAEPLPWRQHRGGGESTPAPERRKLSSSTSRGSVSLAALARRDSRLEYDEQSGMAQVDVEIPFEPGSARLNEDGRKALDELSRWLQTNPAKSLRVLVAGYAEGKQSAAVGDGKKNFANSRQLGAARAQAVADYLDRHGIAEERIGVTAVGSSTPVLASRKGSRSAVAAEAVQVFVAEPDATVVGWWPHADTLRR